MGLYSNSKHLIITFDLMDLKRNTRILGIDPGTNFLGYAVIEVIGREVKLIECDVLNIKKGFSPQEKLEAIFKRITFLIDKHLPHSLAIEAPFFGKNIQSMLKLGRAQGIAMAAGISKGIEIIEYSPKKVKQSVTGNGNASKEQVKAMITSTFYLKADITSFDAADALAVAMCHHYQTSNGVNTGTGGNSWKKFLRDNPKRISKL